MKVLLPGSLNLVIEDERIEAVQYDERQPIPAQHRDAQVLATWANSRANLADATTLTRLELVQTVTAGPDRVLAAGFDERVRIASGRSLHDAPVAEHTLTLILAAVRRLDRLRDAQTRHEWARDYIREQAAPRTAQQFTLDGAHVVIWGFGSIALHLAPILQALGARVTGIANSAGTRGGFDVVDNPWDVIGSADVLVSLLPASPETESIIDERVLRELGDAIFVNVGRGVTVDEEALINALTSGQLRYAALDVMRTEPLPAESPLWDTPNLLLTPHVAGGRPQGAEGLIRRNVLALLDGQPLVNFVER